MNVWERAKAIQAQGGQPTIQVNTSMLLPPTPGKRGRPKKPHKEWPYGHYLVAKLWGAKGRVRCANPECKRRLKASDAAVCSPYCREVAYGFYVRLMQVICGYPLRVPRGKVGRTLVKAGPPAVPYSSQELAASFRKGRGRPRGRAKRAEVKG